MYCLNDFNFVFGHAYESSSVTLSKAVYAFFVPCFYSLFSVLSMPVYFSDFVAKWLQRRTCPEELEKMLPEKMSWNAADFAMLQNQEAAMSHLPWYSLTWKMRRTVPEIKAYWYQLFISPAATFFLNS